MKKIAYPKQHNSNSITGTGWSGTNALASSPICLVVPSDLIHNNFANIRTAPQSNIPLPSNSYLEKVAATLILISTSLYQVVAHSPGLSQAWRSMVSDKHEVEHILDGRIVIPMEI